MKLRLLALAAMAVAGQAQATQLTLAQINAADVKVYISGSSALNGVIAGQLQQNCDVAADMVTVKSKFGVGSFTGDFADGASHSVFACKLNASGGDFGATYANQTVAIYKRDAGGSVYGVFPVAQKAANNNVNFLDLASTCAGSGIAYTCNFDTNPQLPSGGLSDEEPSLYTYAINQPTEFAGLKVADGDFFSKNVVLQQLFTVGVSNKLRNALQAEQGLATGAYTTGTDANGNITYPNMPSIPLAALTTILQNNFDPSLGWTSILSTDANKLSQVNICRRTTGSGTQAAINLFALQNPTNKLAQDPWTALDTDGAAIGTAVGGLYVRESLESTDLRNCLAEADVGNAYAVGPLTVSSGTAGNGAAGSPGAGGSWSLVKIDGLTPHRDYAKRGKFPFIVESTMQISKGATTAQKAFLTQFMSAIGKPSNMTSLSANAKTGVLALPTNTECAGGSWPSITGPGSTNPELFCSRLTRGGNSFVLPYFVR